MSPKQDAVDPRPIPEDRVARPGGPTDPRGIDSCPRENGHIDAKRSELAAQVALGLTSLALTALVAWLTYGQQASLLHQGETAAKLAQRAWIRAVAVSLTQEPTDQLPAVVQIAIVNSGLTPANQFRYKAAMAMGRIPTDETMHSRAFMTQGIVAPGTTNKEESLVVTVTETVENGATYESGSAALYLKVTMEYEDVFGDERSTGLCLFRYKRERNFSFCATGNFMD